MKAVKAILVVTVLILIFASCPVQLPFRSLDDQVNQAVDTAGEKNKELVDNVVAAIAEGDLSGLAEFLAAEDRDGELAALLMEYGIPQSQTASVTCIGLEGPTVDDLKEALDRPVVLAECLSELCND